jgi:hypothetical protein
MQFNLGEDWKTVEGSGGPRRAIVAAVKDGGREVTLFSTTAMKNRYLGWFSRKRANGRSILRQTPLEPLTT